MSESAAAGEVRQFTVSAEDDGIRLDRWFKRNLADASFNLVSRWARTGQLRVDGKRAVPGDRVEAGQIIRVPPAEAPANPKPKSERPALSQDQVAYVNDMVIQSDAAAIVVNKPPGLATQGGTKTNVHLDGLLDGLAGPASRAPSSSTGSTRTRRARCCSRARRAPRPFSPGPSPGAPRARSIGHW
ncbi:MAG: RluA family pseudouridine synthase [Alphaproteobacteria bacterium]|nr:RluA family pseudouridine synthase [Alphaproteobacteria bacterium]